MVKLMIVDDEEQNLEWLQDLFEREGYEVVIAVNGIEALKKIEINKPDLILSDILMPVMDGFALCRELKKDENLQAIPFIFFSATYKDSQDEELAYKLGAVRFLRKPMRPEDIVKNIRDILIESAKSQDGDRQSRKIDEDDFLREYSAIISSKLVEKVSLLKELEEKRDIVEKSLRTILEMSVDAIISVNTDGLVTVWSAGAEHIFGYKKEEVVGSPLTIIIPGEKRQEAEDIVAEVRRKGYVRGFETERLAKDGRRIEVEMSLTELGPEVGTTAIMRDITTRNRAKREQEKSLVTLQKAFQGTIEAMAVTVETRDPYTAGHQKRVAELSCVIASEMGLAENHIEGLRMAGLIHDLGKISVPAEILSKPGKLWDIEFEIIMRHPESGYEILKKINFPWPVARIVLQHHERHNSSGYPSGLKGRDCLIESRIISVADVVEAMASHRPYRPALGLDAALEEIASKRNILYDPEIVDVCLKILQEGKFTWSTG